MGNHYPHIDEEQDYMERRARQRRIRRERLRRKRRRRMIKRLLYAVTIGLILILLGVGAGLIHKNNEEEKQTEYRQRYMILHPRTAQRPSTVIRSSVPMPGIYDEGFDGIDSSRTYFRRRSR